MPDQGHTFASTVTTTSMHQAAFQPLWPHTLLQVLVEWDESVQALLAASQPASQSAQPTAQPATCSAHAAAQPQAQPAVQGAQAAAQSTPTAAGLVEAYEFQLPGHKLCAVGTMVVQNPDGHCLM